MVAPFFPPPDKQAEDLETAWQNFDPQLPLPGGNHPFYEPRLGEPLGRLVTALKLSAAKQPKFLFAGYRGSGKSTELNRLALNPDIQKCYWIARYSVRDATDIYTLDYRDLLVTLGAQVYTQYLATGRQLDPKTIQALESWKTRTVERVREKGTEIESGGGLDLKAFFAALTLKMKTEHRTREQIRDVISPQISDLLTTIDLIATDIQVIEKKPVLVLVDDLDKLTLDNARRLFCDNWESITQPKCAIVYTTPSSILYEDRFMSTSLAPETYLIPNIRLHSKGLPQHRDDEGYRFFRKFIERRTRLELFDSDVVEELIALSGGVTYALVFAVQAALNNALQRDVKQVTKEDVAWARAQLRNPLLVLLSDEDMAVLRDMRRDNPDRLPDPQKHTRLVHIQAILQYPDEQNNHWFDAHPVLAETLLK